MVEEGLFKKRIPYIYTTYNDLWLDRKDIPEDVEYHPDPRLDEFISVADYEKMIDEAKKEFPASSKLLSWWASLSEEDRRHYLAMYEPDDIRSYHKLDWFLKWFGERV